MKIIKRTCCCLTCLVASVLLACIALVVVLASCSRPARAAALEQLLEPCPAAASIPSNLRVVPVYPGLTENLVPTTRPLGRFGVGTFHVLGSVAKVILACSPTGALCRTDDSWIVTAASPSGEHQCLVRFRAEPGLVLSLPPVDISGLLERGTEAYSVTVELIDEVAPRYSSTPIFALIGDAPLPLTPPAAAVSASPVPTHAAREGTRQQSTFGESDTARPEQPTSHAPDPDPGDASGATALVALLSCVAILLTVARIRRLAKIAVEEAAAGASPMFGMLMLKVRGGARSMWLPLHAWIHGMTIGIQGRRLVPMDGLTGPWLVRVSPGRVGPELVQPDGFTTPLVDRPRGTLMINGIQVNYHWRTIIRPIRKLSAVGEKGAK